MEQEIREILLHYPIQKEQILTLKPYRVWEIKEKNDTYILKALFFPKAERDFIFDAMEQLKTNGFSFFNQAELTKSGGTHIDFAEKGWFLSKKIIGKPANFIDDRELSLIGGFLANFHNHACGYFPSAPYEGRVKWGTWASMVAEKKKDLLDFNINNKKESFFDIAFCRYLDYFLEDLEKAAPFFASSDFHRLCRQEKEKGVFCHHDLAYHNILMGENPYLVDFDYLLADIRCHDVANCVTKVLKANGWEAEKALTFLSAYNKVRTLEKVERDAIKAMLRFPQDYWQCAFAHYREGDVSRSREKKLKHWLKERTLRRNALFDLETEF